jgi:hypothetical protein
MRLDHLYAHQELSRRQAVRLGAIGAATVGLAASGSAASVRAAGAPTADHGDDGPRFDDTMFDPAAVIAGAWAPSRYGVHDQRGALNELTPHRVSAALGLLQQGRPVHTYQVGEEVFNGFPPFPASPPRQHEMRLLAYGYQPLPEFVQGGGLLGSTEPLGPNLASVHEERFKENYTFQIATQLDGLGHVGVGGVFYNGLRGDTDLASPSGLRKLGNETVGPIVTRAVIYDVVGLKVARGATGDYFKAENGQPVLRGDYRITIADLRACLERQRVRGVGAGDIPIIHTGWTHLAHTAPQDYLKEEPGIYLAEARYFAHRRVAAIASDTWGLEVTSPAVTSGNVFPCHQELLVKHGIRIGEGFVTDAAIADNVYEGVLVITPQNVPGATASSAPPVLLGQPGKRPRS